MPASPAPPDPGNGHAGGVINTWGDMDFALHIPRETIEAIIATPSILALHPEIPPLERAAFLNSIYNKIRIFDWWFGINDWWYDSLGAFAVSPPYALPNNQIVQAFLNSYNSVVCAAQSLSSKIYSIPEYHVFLNPPLGFQVASGYDYGSGGPGGWFVPFGEYYEWITVTWVTRVCQPIIRKSSIIPILAGGLLLSLPFLVAAATTTIATATSTPRYPARKPSA